MKAHPVSGVFPLIDGLDLRALVEDITAHGLIEPIVLLDGMVLDGRNRLRACELAGVEPRFVEWEPGGLTPVEWVVAKNLHRRHLTTAQRAALALDLLPHLEAEARERMLAGKAPDPTTETAEGSTGESAAKAAEMVGVGATTIKHAKAIQNRDPDLVTRMWTGELNVAQASREAGLSGGRGGAEAIVALDEGKRSSDGKAVPVYFGRGDKWAEASTPLTRYLAAWEKRDWRFGHVNYREARKRIAVIDDLIAGLTAARADLESRSHKTQPFTP